MRINPASGGRFETFKNFRVLRGLALAPKGNRRWAPFDLPQNQRVKTPARQSSPRRSRRFRGEDCKRLLKSWKFTWSRSKFPRIVLRYFFADFTGDRQTLPPRFLMRKSSQLGLNFFCIIIIDLSAVGTVGFETVIFFGIMGAVLLTPAAASFKARMALTKGVGNGSSPR